MLKETPSSLRAYFALIALFMLLPLVGEIAAGQLGAASVRIVFGGLYAYIAYRMEHLLAHRPGFIRGVITFNLAFFCFGAAVGIYKGQGFSSLPFVAIAFAITTYLWVSVSRLSKEVSVKLIKTRERAAESAPPILPPNDITGGD